MLRGSLLSVAFLALANVAAAADEATPPPALDYADPSHWVCRPDLPACHDDLTTAVLEADGKTRLERFTPAADPRIDCFYVYPTVSESSDLNAPPRVTEAERRAVRQQFARFAAVCRLFAPVYRQFTEGRMKVKAPVERAERMAGFRLAQSDVKAAWDHYLAHDNHGRGVVLIGHSQGAGQLEDLMRSEIDGKPLQARLVTAIVPGSGVTAPHGQDVGGSFKSIPVCRRDGQTGCVIVFNSFRPEALIPPREVMQFAGGETLCTNPAALAGGKGALKPYLSTTGETIIPDFTAPQGAWTSPPRTIRAPFVTLPGYYAAECRSDEHGVYLAIVAQPAPGDRRTGALTGDWIQDNQRNVTMGLHLIDLNLVMGNLIDIVRRQAEAWCARPDVVCGAKP